jgi:hypothetical protein
MTARILLFLLSTWQQETGKSKRNGRTNLIKFMTAFPRWKDPGITACGQASSLGVAGWGIPEVKAQLSSELSQVRLLCILSQVPELRQCRMLDG